MRWSIVFKKVIQVNYQYTECKLQPTNLQKLWHDTVSVTCQKYALGNYPGLVFAEQAAQYPCAGSGEGTGDMRCNFCPLAFHRGRHVRAYTSTSTQEKKKAHFDGSDMQEIDDLAAFVYTQLREGEWKWVGGSSFGMKHWTVFVRAQTQSSLCKGPMRATQQAEDAWPPPVPGHISHSPTRVGINIGPGWRPYEFRPDRDSEREQ